MALSALGYLKHLGHTKIDLTVKQTKDLKAELAENLSDYVGNENQIKLAEKVGIRGLPQLYTGVSSLGFVEKLGHKSIRG